jgi:hypothetical protein
VDDRLDRASDVGIPDDFSEAGVAHNDGGAADRSRETRTCVPREDLVVYAGYSHSPNDHYFGEVEPAAKILAAQPK